MTGAGNQRDRQDQQDQQDQQDHQTNRGREPEWLAERFEANRAHPKAVAYRTFGSLSEADDAV